MYQKELDLAIRAATAAGEVLKKRENISVSSAEGKDLKLSTDKESEGVIVDLLRTESVYPVLSEECGSVGEADQSGYRWIVDPLDGTVNYYRNIPELSCVSIALWRGDTPVLGVINRYAVDELYWGAAGSGGYCISKIFTGITSLFPYYICRNGLSDCGKGGPFSGGLCRLWCVSPDAAGC